jgi:hypothetical protein
MPTVREYVNLLEKFFLILLYTQEYLTGAKFHKDWTHRTAIS